MIMKPVNRFRKGVFTRQWKDAVYTTNFLVAIVESLSDFKQAYAAVSGKTTEDAWEDDLDQTAAFVEDFLEGNQHHVILVFERRCGYGIVAHEANHAVNKVFKHHGTKLDLENDEHQSYYLGHIVDNVLDGYEEYDKRKAKVNAKPKKQRKG